MNFTDEQREAIARRGKIIVSAAAGSGKTSVMIERLVSLILSGTDVREVLALTFTNKAAAQMRDKLRTALSERLITAEGEERERLKDQLSALPLAEIGTIHAFCGRLVRTHFYLAGVDAAFQIISPDDAEGAALKGRAIDLVFEEAYEGDPAFMDLLSVYFRKKKDKRLKKIVFTLYSSLRELCDYRELLLKTQSHFADACNYLAEGYSQTARFLSERLEELRPYFLRENARAANVLNDVVAACAAIEGKDLFAMRETALAPLRIATMPPMTKAAGEELKNLRFLSGAAKKIKEVYGELREFSDAETERAHGEQADRRAASLAALVLRFDETYSLLKREANVLDYNDLEQFALNVLSDGEALAAVKGRFTHVFVDEYQDVNRVQERILSMIAGEEVFLVGDSKQAIYGFRGSSSAFFDEKRASFRAFGGDLPLNRNFRSGSAVLETVNSVFSFVRGYEPMAGGDRYREHGGEVRFHMVEAEKEEKKAPRVYSVREHTGGRKSDATARLIADLIEEEIASDIYDADEGRVRKANFSDIAVLVRKHSGEMEEVVRELATRDIPVSAAAAVNVCDFSEARLLIDWLSLIDNAEQDAPLASALLSRVGGFDEDELSSVRLCYPDAYFFRTACRLYAFGGDDKIDRKTDPIAIKLKNFFVFLKDLRLRAQSLSAADVLSSLLSMGLETQIAAGKNGTKRLARARRLLAESEGKSVHRFLADLKASDYRLDYAGGGGEDAVQVLTMHASKGLEYPVVILADLDVPFHGAERGDVLFSERFGIAPYAYDIERRKVYSTVLRRATEFLQEEEERVGETNLLYVAMTRAKYCLHMLFAGKNAAVAPAYAARLSDFIDLAALNGLFVPPPAPQERPLARPLLGGREDPALVGKLRAVYRVPYAHRESTFLPLKSSATDLMRRTVSEPVHAGESGPVHTKEEGLAYHAFLQRVRFGSSAAEELARMREEGLLTADELKLLDAEKLQKILSLPCLKGLESKRLWREQTFLTLLPACDLLPTAAEDEILFQGAIDLLVEDEEGFTVIDYKFSGHDDGRIASDYALQISLYRKAVARTMGVREESIRARIVNIALLREIEM